MHYFLLFMTVFLESAKTLLLTQFSKNSLKEDADIYKFNTLLYMGSLAVILVSGIGRPSFYSVWMGVLFALVTAGCQIFFLMALRHGPLSYTSFLQGVSLVIPVLAGVLFMNETISPIKIAAFPVLLVSLIFVFNLSREKLTLRWAILAVLSMTAMGLVGVVQTVHQASVHKDESGGFLLVAFISAIVMNFLLWMYTGRNGKKTFPIRGQALPLALVSGVFMGIVNVVNLYLAGVMPKVVFFPISNGGLTVVTLLGSVLFFKEKLHPKQWAGILVCIAALCVLGI